MKTLKTFLIILLGMFIMVDFLYALPGLEQYRKQKIMPVGYSCDKPGPAPIHRYRQTQFTGVITITKRFRFTTSIRGPDVYAINYAYDRGGNGVVISGVYINFTKRSGQRISPEELDLLIEALKDMPGPTATSYWKRDGWEAVREYNGKLYWPDAPHGQRELNAAEVELYRLWQETVTIDKK